MDGNIDIIRKMAFYEWCRRFHPSWFKFDGKIVLVQLHHMHHIVAKLCTSHDSTAVVPCTNSHSDHLDEDRMKFPLNLNYDGKIVIVREMDPKASLSVHQIECAKSGGRANADSNVTLLMVFHMVRCARTRNLLGTENAGSRGPTLCVYIILSLTVSATRSAWLPLFIVPM